MPCVSQRPSLCVVSASWEVVSFLLLVVLFWLWVGTVITAVTAAKDAGRLEG